MYPPSLSLSFTPRVLRCGGGGGGYTPVASAAPPPPPPAPPEVAPLLLGASETDKDGTNTTANKLKIGKKKLQVPLGAAASSPASSSTGVGVPSP